MKIRWFVFYLISILGFTAQTVADPTSSDRRLEPQKDQKAAVGTVAITSHWSICVPKLSHQAVGRAARDLQSFLKERHGLAVTISNVATGSVIRLAVNEKLQGDRFSLRFDEPEKQVSVQGSSPLAVYQGVLALEEQLAQDASLSRSYSREIVYPFQDRYILWNSLLTGQNKGAIGFDLEKHLREAVRLGYTGMECNRFVGMTIVQQGNPRDSYPWYTYWGPSMDQFVTSPLMAGAFPNDYLQRNLADLKQVVAVTESFGLKPIFMGYEPRYVPNDFLREHPHLRGPRVDHPLRSMESRYSLCTDRPEVLSHYRVLAKRLAMEVPGIREMHIIFHDSGAGLCWSNSLYSGRNGPEYCRHVPMGTRLNKFFMAIKTGLRDGGLDIPLVAQPHGVNRRETDDFLNSLPSEIEMTAGNWASWSLAYEDPLEMDRYLVGRLRETGRRSIYYQNHFFGFHVAPTTEFPIPYSLAKRLKNAQRMKLDVLNTLGGIVSPPIKNYSAMQEVYRQFLLQPDLSEPQLVEFVAHDLGGKEGGPQLVEIWQVIESAVKKNGRSLGFAMGTEYASRRTLVRPLVPEATALSPDEREWWLAHTFEGNLRFGHAHLFRGEGGLPKPKWYRQNFENSVRARKAFEHGASQLQAFLDDHPIAAQNHSYLVSHERQLRFLAHVYSTGAHLYEGQRILDKYSKKSIYDELKQQVDADASRFRQVVQDEIDNTQALLTFIEQGGDVGMVLLPQETTWAYGPNLSQLLQRKIDAMKQHLPEIDKVLQRWFNSEY